MKGSNLNFIGGLFRRIARLRGDSLDYLEKAITLNCNGNSPVKVVPVSSRSSGELLDVVVGVAGEARDPLILVPGRALKRIITKTLGDVRVACYDEGVKVEGGSVILVLPEVHYRSLAGGHDLNDNLDFVKMLEDVTGFDPCRFNTIVLTRFFNVDVEVTSRGRVLGGVGELLYQESLELFNKLYGGLTPSKGQRIAWSILSAMLEEGGSLIVVMPTGSGKSAIFHVASRLASSNGIGSYTLVVTPLRALMRDQVNRVTMRGLKAILVDSTIPRSRRVSLYNAIRRGLVDLLYVSPERFWDPEFRKLLEREPPSLIVLDEVHVITSWGSTFRPSYLNVAKTLASYRVKFKPPILGLSATLTLSNAHSILRMLGHRRKPIIIDLDSMEDVSVSVDPEVPVVVRSNPVRRNLHFEVTIAPWGYDRLRYVAEVARDKIRLSKQFGAGIGVVFTGYAESRVVDWANADSIARALRESLGVETLVYHGELGDRVRRSVENLVLKGNLGEAVVVATKAFGMGVDIPNIRWVIFYTLPDSLEELYQESGRAGRDGGQAYITILYNPEDVKLKRRLAWISRLRPSYMLRVNNTIAKIRDSLPEDHEYIVVPLDIFEYKIYALRALEMLRGEGLLDYHVVRGSKLVLSSKGEGTYMKLGDSKYVVISGEGSSVDVQVCRGNPLYDPVRFVVKGEVRLATGRCPGRWVEVSLRHGILVIEVTGESLRFKDSLEPHLMYSYVRSWVEVERELASLVNVVEKALAGGERADLIVKSEVNSYFESRTYTEPRIPETPKLLECRSQDCYRRAVEELRRLIESIGGPQGITVFYEKPWDPGLLAREYAKTTGLSIALRTRGLGKLVNMIGRWGWERLLDEGYIVVLTKPGKRFSKLVEVLGGYRYHVTIVWR